MLGSTVSDQMWSATRDRRLEGHRRPIRRQAPPFTSCKSDARVCDYDYVNVPVLRRTFAKRAHTDLNRARLPIPPHPRAGGEDIAGRPGVVSGGSASLRPPSRAAIV